MKYTEEMLSRICKNCGYRFGLHRAEDDACPSTDEDNRIFGGVFKETYSFEEAGDE